MVKSINTIGDSSSEAANQSIADSGNDSCKANAASVPNYNTVVGELVEITDAGVPWVKIAENRVSPIVARSALALDGVTLPVKVTIVFENGDTNLPVITGVIGDTVTVEGGQKEISAFANNPRVKVDGEYITFDAQKEILLQCGKSSIMLRRDGKIVIKGLSVTSRASGSNKIKGSSVNIN